MPGLNTVRYATAFGRSNIRRTDAILDSAVNSADAYVVKYNTDGAPQWAARISTAAADSANGIFVHTDGSVYVVGSYTTWNAGIFHADGAVFTTLANSGGTDLFIVKYNSNGIGQWAARIAGSGSDVGRGVAVDSSGNVYIAGDFATTATVFNADTTTFGTLTSAGSTDSIIVKYNSNGVAQWTGRIASTVADLGNAIAVDSTGAVYIVGQSGGAATAYNADGSAFASTLANLGGTDGYLVKYNASGVIQWTARFGTTLGDNGRCVITDSLNNVYVGGSGGASTVSFYNANGGAAFSPGLTNLGAGDAILGKYNSSGTVLWNAKIGGTAADVGHSLAIDSAGNVYAGGTSASATVVGYNANGTSGGSVSAADGWIVKYNSSGTVQYVNRTSMTAGTGAIYGINIDSSDNLYAAVATGTSYGTCDFYNSTIAGNNLYASISQINTNTDSFLVEYNSSGAVQWVRRIASSGSDQSFGVTVDTAGNSYTCGQFTGSRFAIYGQATSLFSTLANVGDQDTFAIKYNTNGAPQWAARIASTAADLGWSTAVDSSGNLYVGGTYAATLTLYNADGSAFGTTLADGTGFIAKYTSSGFVMWATRFTGNDTTWPYAMAVDLNNNLYVCGEYRASTASFYNSDGTLGLTLNSSAFQNGDVYLIKYTSAGVAQWAVRCTSVSGFETGLSVTADSSGSIYFSGNYGQTMSIISSNGVTFGTTLPTGGGIDAFLIKLDSSGIVTWATRVSAGGNDYGFSVTTDSSGNVYFAGVYAGNPATLYNSDGTTFGTLPGVGINEGFLAKYTSNGFVTWAVRMTNTSNIINDQAFACKVDSQGNIYVGLSGGPPTLYNSDGTAYPVTGNALVKYNPSGFVQWVCSINSAGQSATFSLALDSSDNIYTGIIAGGDSRNAQLTNSDGSTFATMSGAFSAMVKYNKNGFGQWVQNISTLSTPSALTRTVSIAATPAGDVYLTGQGASGSAIQIYNIDNTIYKYLNTLASQSAFIVKSSSTGVPQWAVRISMPSSSVQTVKTQLDDSRNVYIAGNIYQTGSTVSTATFYNADGTTAQTLTAKSFIAKYNADGVFQWCAGITSIWTSVLNGMSIETANGNVAITGTFDGASGVTFYNSDGSVGGNGYVPASTANYTYVAKYAANGYFAWAATQYASLIFTFSVWFDSLANIFVGGRYIATGTANFTLRFTNAGQISGTGTGNFGNTAAGIADGFVAKYDFDGIYKWCSTFGGTTGAVTNDIVTSSSGDVYITGAHASTITILNGALTSSGRTTFGTLQNSNSNDVFIIKFNTNGTGQWSARVSGISPDVGFGITLDSASNVYVTGYFSGTARAHNANTTQFSPTVTSLGSADMLLVKYDSAGTVQWITRGGSADVAQNDQGNAVVTDSTGAVYVAGLSGAAGGTAFTVWGVSGGTLVQFASTASAPTTGNTAEAFLVKYDSAGAVQWISKYGGSGSSAITSIAIDTSANIYTAGYFNASGLVPSAS